jgi:lysophospholipid acyltransferase (LPLAT)-like uncharacterized protein
MLAWLIKVAARLLARTWRIQGSGRAPLEDRLNDGPVVVAILHGELLPLVLLHQGLPMVGLVSHSRDGDLAAAVLLGLGFQVVRGSSSRGGSAALREAQAAVSAGRSPVFTVDGPRGPAGVPQVGALLTSRVTSAPLVWARANSAWCWRLGSWDRFCVPLPFSRVTLRYGDLAPVGEGASGLEDARRALQTRLSG